MSIRPLSDPNGLTQRDSSHLRVLSNTTAQDTNSDKFDLDTPLFRLSGEAESEIFTLRDSFTSIGIFGQTGSGKSSGSASLLARSFIRAGYAGCVLTAKTDDVVM